MTDFLDEKRQEIQSRLAELRPLIDEYQRLEAAVAALQGVGGTTTPVAIATAAPARRGPGRPKGSGRKPGRPPGRPKGSGRKPGRPKGSGRKAATATTEAAAPAATATATKAPARRGRPPGRRKGSGTRSVQALDIVKGQPGVTIPELAARMGIKQNYLYRVLPGLEQEGKVKKQGRGWHPGSKS